MRDIKFRAVYKGNLYDVGAIDLIGHRVTLIKKNAHGSTIARIEGLTFAEVELLQYSGLKDRNGVEIYEGDILDTTIELMRYVVVRWDDENAGFFMDHVLPNGIHRKGYLSSGDHESIVIGNIYEHPELLAS